MGVARKRARTRDRVRDASVSIDGCSRSVAEAQFESFLLKPNRQQQRHRINPCAITVWSVREWMGGEVFQVDGRSRGKKEGKVEDELKLDEFIVSFFFFFFLLVRGGSC